MNEKKHKKKHTIWWLYIFSKIIHYGIALSWKYPLCSLQSHCLVDLVALDNPVAGGFARWVRVITGEIWRTSKLIRFNQMRGDALRITQQQNTHGHFDELLLIVCFVQVKRHLVLRQWGLPAARFSCEVVWNVVGLYMQGKCTCHFIILYTEFGDGLWMPRHRRVVVFQIVINVLTSDCRNCFLPPIQH